MRTADQLRDFLRSLEAAIPPPANCHHVITFAHYGDEEKLALQVNRSGTFICFFLDNEDFELRDDALISQIVAMMPGDGDDFQRGIGPGQYSA